MDVRTAPPDFMVIRPHPISVKPVRASSRDLASRLVCGALLLAIVLTVFMTAALDENFWWTDGASFALNGELIRDYLRSGWGEDPITFASNWFLHYPALTISLYPPIFPLAEALVFTLFGFSHGAAQATVAAFAVLAAYGLYKTARSAMGVIPATSVAILLFASPEVLRWSRQIVMEIPTLAFLLLSAACLLRYQATRSLRRLFGAVVLGLAAAYTKQTALFVLPAFALALLVDEGTGLFRRRANWLALGVGLLGLVPLALFTVHFAGENFNIAFGAGTGEKSYARLSLQALTAYGGIMLEVVGPLGLAGTALFLGMIRWRGWRSIAERRLAILMLAWFIVDYVLISVTADFETRYATFLTVPPAVLTGLFLVRVFPARFAATGILAVCAAWFGLTVQHHPVATGGSYADVAQYVLDQGERNAVVMFHGKNSKSFSFSLRAKNPDGKLFVLRAEKFLVNYNIIRDWGISDANLAMEDVDAMIDRYGVSWFVFQPDFWTDQPSVALLQKLVYSDRFTKVAEFPVASEAPGKIVTISVYRNNRPSPPANDQIRINLPAFGGAISGRL